MICCPFCESTLAVVDLHMTTVHADGAALKMTCRKCAEQYTVVISPVRGGGFAYHVLDGWLERTHA